jgi:hypothetical protein
VAREYLTGERIILAAVGLLLAAPFLVFRDIPLYDLPSHIARQYILFGGGAPGASQYYGVDWRLLPNLALDGWVGALHAMFGVDLAVRLFLAVSVLLLFGGALALNHVLFPRQQHCMRVALAAALFAYNGPLLFGFVNLSFGIGLALCGFAAWLRWRERVWALPAFATLASLILLAHLFACAVYALMVLAYATNDARRGWRALRPTLLPLCHLALPAAIYLFLMPREAIEGSFRYAPVMQKLAALVSAIGFYNPCFDLICLVAVLALLVLGLPRLRLARDMTAVLVALGLAFILLPHQLGEGSFVDYRMPSVFTLVLAGSLSWREPAAPRRHVAEALILGLFLVRWIVLVTQWGIWQADFAEYRAAFALLPQGAKLLPLEADPNSVDFAAHPPLAHIASLAVSLRGALIPSLFADAAGHQLLFYREPYRRLFNLTPTKTDAPVYDYVLLVRPGEMSADQIPAYLPILRGRTFILGRLDN